MTSLSSLGSNDHLLLEKIGIKYRSKLWLGALCKYGHEWNGSGMSLRRGKKGTCYFCYTRNDSGIYKIECNKHVYIGQSVNMQERWSSHLCSLRNGYHANIFLQRIYNKYSEDCISFTRLTTLDRKFCASLSNEDLVKVLNNLEQIYFNIYNPDVNASKIAGNSFGCYRDENYYDYLSEVKQKPFCLYHPDSGYINGVNLSKFADSLGDIGKAVSSGLYAVISGATMSYKGYFRDEESYNRWQQMKDSYTSTFTGVSLQEDKWRASIYYPGTKQCEYLGLFDDEVDASLAYQQAKIDIMEGIFEEKQKNRKQKIKDRKLSKYPGVTWDKTRKHWKAFIRFNGKRVHLGAFKNEKDAFSAYEKASEEKTRGIFIPPKPTRSSKYKGVSWVESRKKWTSHAWVNRRSVFLGYFLTELEAHYAYENYMATHRASA